MAPAEDAGGPSHARGRGRVEVTPPPEGAAAILCEAPPTGRRSAMPLSATPRRASRRPPGGKMAAGEGGSRPH